MSTVTDTDLQQLKDLITAGQLATQQQIAELALNIQKQLADSALDSQKQVNGIELGMAQLEGKIGIIDERTKLGFWGFIFRGTALSALAALTAIFVKYLFPILPPELPKF
jgi:hypothetical protein